MVATSSNRPAVAGQTSMFTAHTPKSHVLRAYASPNRLLHQAGSAALSAGLDLLHGPGVSIGISEAEERAAIALVEGGDLLALTPRLSNSSRAAYASATTSWRPFMDPGAIASIPGPSPNTMEQPDPAGVSCVTCICGVIVSWSSAKPT